MTDYSSQGKTRPHNVADLNNLKIHQAYYTALSQSSTAEGTIILQGFDVKTIMGGASGAFRQEFCKVEILDEITALDSEHKLHTTVVGKTWDKLVRAFREWKGHSCVPFHMHKAIWWSKCDPFEQSLALDNWNINTINDTTETNQND